MGKPTSDAEEELQKLQLQLCEEKVKSETLAASREHFRRKVEELCRKLLLETEKQEKAENFQNPGASVGVTPPGPAKPMISDLANDCLESENSAGSAASADGPLHSVDWLRQQKRELLETGLYTEELWPSNWGLSVWHVSFPFVIFVHVECLRAKLLDRFFQKVHKNPSLQTVNDCK